MTLFDNSESSVPAGTARSFERIADAADAVGVAHRRRDIDELLVAHDELCAAVQAAVYGLGVSWQSIGDVLGIRRGSAYQQFRRRPGFEPGAMSS